MTKLNQVKIEETKIGGIDVVKYSVYNPFLDKEWGIITPKDDKNIEKLPKEIGFFKLEFFYEEPKIISMRIENLLELNEDISASAENKVFLEKDNVFTGCKRYIIEDKSLVGLTTKLKNFWIGKLIEGENTPFFIKFPEKGAMVLWGLSKINQKIIFDNNQYNNKHSIPTVITPSNYKKGEYRLLLHNTGRGAITDYWLDQTI